MNNIKISKTISFHLFTIIKNNQKIKIISKLNIGLIFILFFINGIAQNTYKNNPFIMVEIPDSLRAKLACSELQKNNLVTSFDSSYMAMYIRNLIDPQDYLFKDGIYTYNLMGPHFQRKLFIFSKGEIYIFKSIYINDVLDEYLIFLKETDIPVLKRIEYLNAIAKYLEEEYKNRNDK